MPAIPAITYHSHVSLDAAPFRLDDETYLLMQRARVTATSDKSQRFVDLLGNCFLRVESDQRLQYSIDFFTAVSNGLADYHPGRALSARAVAFAAGSEQRHQFLTGGIFIYESATDEDPAGELRSGNVVISYDLHAGLDTTTYPTTGGGDYDGNTYADIPVQSTVEIGNTAKNYLLQDIFYGESNLDAAFTIEAYEGATLRATATLTDAWTTTTAISGRQRYAVAPDAITFTAAGAVWSIDSLKLKRGSIEICTVTLGVAKAVASGAVLRIPAGNLKISLNYHPGPDTAEDGAEVSADENPCNWFLGYVLGGTRAVYLPSDILTVEIYTTSPGTTVGAVPLDSVAIQASTAAWSIIDRVCAPAAGAEIAGINPAPDGGWSVGGIVVRLGGLRIAAMNMLTTMTVAAGSPFVTTSLATPAPSIDIDG